MASFGSSKKRKSSSTSKVTKKFRVCRPLCPPDGYDKEASYDWSDALDNSASVFLPVDKFKKAPLQNVFHHLRIGLKIEIPNIDYFNSAKSVGGVYWVAHVQKIAGYKALLRYEGATDDSHDLWMNLCTSDVHPVGWCAAEGKPLVPPKFLQDKQDDWKNYLVKRLTGARTFPPDWPEKIKKSFGENMFRVGQRIEIIDRKVPSRVRPGLVDKVIGRRIKVIYSLKDQPKHKGGKKDDDDENEMDPEFWCNCYSPLIFPVGWASRTGYQLHASEAYKKHAAAVVESDPTGEATVKDTKNAKGKDYNYDAVDTRPGQFKLYPVAERSNSAENGSSKKNGWKAGMKLELLDIMDMNYIHAATVTKVLKGGSGGAVEWLQIDYDGGDDDTFPIHKDSPYMFPVGFCAKHNIELQVPKKHERNFKWPDYLAATNSTAAPAALFDSDDYNTTGMFEAGGKLESVDNADPKLISPATVLGKKGSRLVKLGFDGWSHDFDQFADFRSIDLFPIGYAEMIGYKLELPKESEDENSKDDGGSDDEPPSKKK